MTRMTQARVARAFPRLGVTSLLGAALLLVMAGRPAVTSANGAVPLPVTAVDTVGFTVSDMDRALAFYTGVLPFAKVSEHELSGRPYELLSGLFGDRARVVRLRLGSEQIELTEFLAPKGRPLPADLVRTIVSFNTSRSW